MEPSQHKKDDSNQINPESIKTNSNEAMETKTAKKPRSKLIIPLIIVVILAIAGIAAAIYFFIQSQNKPECESTVTYVEVEAAATDTEPTKIGQLMTEQLVAKFIDYDYYESGGKRAVLKALSGDFHNEDYMAFVALKNDWFNLANIQSWIEGNSIANDGVFVYRDELQSSVRSFFGDSVSINKNEFSLGCALNLKTSARRTEVYEFYAVGCGGTGHGGDMFFVDKIIQGDSALAIDIVFADYVTNPADPSEEFDGTFPWFLSKNNNGEAIQVVELSGDLTNAAANQYLREHPDQFNKYRFNFVIEEDRIILAGIDTI